MEIHGRPWSGWPIIIHHHPETSYSHQWQKGVRQIYVLFYQDKQGGWFVSGKQEAKFLQVHLDTKENKCFLVSDHAVFQFSGFLHFTECFLTSAEPPNIYRQIIEQFFNHNYRAQLHCLVCASKDKESSNLAYSLIGHRPPLLSENYRKHI